MTGISERRLNLKNVDVFVFFNVVLFVLMCIFVYYDRFVTYRGTGNILEFFLYAVLILLTILVSWRFLRAYSFGSFSLVLAEIGILMHFSGGLVHFDGHRLYDNVFLGVRYDKYVHLVNSFTASVLVNHFFGTIGLRLGRLESPVIVLIVLGFGSIIEIVEYIVALTVPQNGVGGYDNNMQDLIANITGGLLYISFSFLQRTKGGNES